MHRDPVHEHNYSNTFPSTQNRCVDWLTRDGYDGYDGYGRFLFLDKRFWLVAHIMHTSSHKDLNENPISKPKMLDVFGRTTHHTWCVVFCDCFGAQSWSPKIFKSPFFRTPNFLKWKIEPIETIHCYLISEPHCYDGLTHKEEREGIRIESF